MGGVLSITHIYKLEKKMKRFFKKNTGVIIEATPNHDIDSLISRFTECDASGKEIKKVVAKPTKKAKKEDK
tara:strand:+ start:1718 stop:1930 length:213 start_codon:yes stop_codon:yes gene_type:complete